MNIETVNELITSLESAGELSIRETKVMALAKAYQQLAAENVALKQAVAEEIEVINRGGQRYCVKDGMSINPIYARGWNDHRSNVTALQTPATDRIVAEAEARGVEKGIAHLEKKFSNIGVQIMNLQWLADSLREGGGDK
ncbi:MAG: hypothetical protein E7L34_03800 [Klebsiella pneumoniae]|nr:hypothetical protein [Klebsiella pneumoniae]MDU7326018.1 hypothetical protein [Klebsiella pneumoniae]